MFVVQDLVRRKTSFQDIACWGLLLLGAFDLFTWSWFLFQDHLEWWRVRTEGLPLFPFRTRLFGSHGSTQAAAWLAVLILLLGRWSIPRTQGVWRGILSGMLAWCAVALGFCDSRLAMGGLLLATFVSVVSNGFDGKLAVATILPNLIWFLRDLAHPSRIASGGGEDQGMLQLGLALGVWTLGMLLNKFRGPWTSVSVRRRAAVIMLLVLSSLALWFPFVLHNGEASWSTGRMEFWRAAIVSWSGSPLWGTGAWSFSWLYSLEHDWLLGFLPMHPHNWGLEVLLAGGLMLVAGLVWAFWGALLTIWRSERLEGVWFLVAIHLIASMSFDSPFSSPQIFLVCQLVGGVALSLVPNPRQVAPSKAMSFVPLLLLVPLGYVVEGLAGKQALERAGELIRLGRPTEGAELVLAADPGPGSDPQWTRNILMARTTLGWNRVDSLSRLAPQWDSMVALEPGFVPNRIHRAAVRARLGMKIDADEVESDLDRVLGNGWGKGVKLGEIPQWWRERYPTDSAGYWMARLRSDSGSNERRWIIRWFRSRIERHSIAEAGLFKALGLLPSSLEIPMAKEGYLYGSEGARWLFIPEISNQITNRSLEIWEM